MKTDLSGSCPVLTCEDAARLEKRVLGGDEAREWAAMGAAGRAVGAAIVEDGRELGGFPPAGRILVLVGKGHNGGDALLAARHLLATFPTATAEVLFVFGERIQRPLARRAWRGLLQEFPGRVERRGNLPEVAEQIAVSLDGIFGFQFRPPADPRVRRLFARIDTLSIRLRAAVDLPSGLGGSAVPRADFTYATGSVKAPLVEAGNAKAVGRLRYLDLGFFEREPVSGRAADRVLTTEVLRPLLQFRDPQGDKRSHGHLMILGGSRSYPGAVLMSVLAALRSGVGLVTAFVPDPHAAAFAARAPGAIWVGWPVTSAGGLAREGRRLLLSRWKRATALAAGPGLTNEPETQSLLREIVGSCPVPLVLDADALHAEIVKAGKAPRILTPHAGEFARMRKGGARLPKATEAKGAPSSPRGITMVLKGPLTRIFHGNARLISPFGGPVLARGGSGDVLTGLAGGLLAQQPSDPLAAACRAVVWHGRAADLLAREKGPVAATTADLIETLPQALRA